MLVIAGVIAVFVLLSLPGEGDERAARDEVRRLERLVTLAGDEALYRLVELGIEFNRDGYRFLVWDGQDWAPPMDPGVLRAHRWPPTLEARLRVENRELPLPERFAIDDPTPQVVFLSSGEVSPFQLELRDVHRRGEALHVHLTQQTERVQLGEHR